MSVPLPKRRAGVLLHPSSLPGAGECGTLGAEARRFVDFLRAAGQRIWQLLPLCPTHGDYSPYQGLSAYAGNPRLIDSAEVEAWGWMGEGESPLERAWNGFQNHADGGIRVAFDAFKQEHAFWLDEYALFTSIREQHGLSGWWQWPAELRDREPEALRGWGKGHAENMERVRFQQFLFYRQWMALKQYANERGIELFGDLPVFLAHDSAEVWAGRRWFRLTTEGEPMVVAGVPPDYFSAEGQRWGNPLYDWSALETDGFHWWLLRLRFQLRLFDWLRIDHFRGFEACWVIPAGEPTAINGRWEKVPGERLFAALEHELGQLPLVAEDLGLITPEVIELRKRFDLPGMKVLQFAFDGSQENPYLPHFHERDAVVYTGTHDNDTSLGWFASLSDEERERVMSYLGYPAEAMPWPLIRAAYVSTANLAVIPMQDLLGLGSESRMNTPGSVEGNWRWRFDWSQLDEGLAARLRDMAASYGRV